MNDLTMDQAALILGVSRQTLYNRLSAMPAGSNARDIVQAELNALRDKIATIESKLTLAILAHPTDG